MNKKMVFVNGIDYEKPKKPTVVICMDGISSDYIENAISFGVAPTFKKFGKNGFYSLARGVIPSYTNPNNISIITGVLPKEHGIVTSGLSFNRRKWNYEMITSQEHMLCDSLLQGFSDNGIKVACITAKDKLRFLLSTRGNSINISAEVAHKFEDKNIKKMIKDSITETRDGKLLEYVDKDWMYSENPSYLSLDLAIELLKGNGDYIPELIYISLSDYIPHRNEPGTEKANSYINGIDKRLKILDEMNAIIGITSDHGMNNKYNGEDKPNVIWLKDILKENKIFDYRILLPITDKYLDHHSCLGSCAWIYSKNKNDIAKVAKIFSEVKEIDETLLNEEAANKYGLEEGLIGDIFLLSNKETVLGTTKSEHLNIPVRLRSHGGVHEQKVPFILNKHLNEKYHLKNNNLRNFNIFEYVLNGG
jgi:phosphonoacetate hydrolase